MTCVNLTFPHRGVRTATTIETRHVALKSPATAYTGVTYQFSHDSMQGSYIDFPGHILETDDGQRADSVDPADFYRMDAAVIHLDRAHAPGGISATALEAAYGGAPRTRAVIVNALGATGPMEIPERSVWLELGVVDWLKQSGCRLLVSDVYESTALEGIFLRLFQAGITAVCMPNDLHKLTVPVVKLTVGFVKLPVTQLPCTLLAEF